MNVVEKRHWELRAPLRAALERRLAAALNIAPLVARLLVLRGQDSPESARSYLGATLADLPDPFLMEGMTAAVERLIRAVENGERVRIHGDYDVDGISGTSLLVELLRLLGARVDYHIPLRLRDGYGLSADALRLAAGDGISLVVSVDCGVTAAAEARLARELGLDLIITDHHQVPPELPDALAVVNPHQPGCAFPDKNLSGVGVAFFVLAALRQTLRRRGRFENRPEPDLRQYLDLVALGTIADVVPLTGINRILVKRGLALIGEGRRVGIEALRKVGAVETVDAMAVGFRLAPRLNAAGRLEDAGLGVELLLETDASAAAEIAARLDRFNAERQGIEKQVFAQARERAEKELPQEQRSIVLADERWHPGVIGIVASRMVERFHRPSILIGLSEGEGKGSGRSVRGFHLVEALRGCSEHLCGFGGHAFAAGISLSEGSVAGFAQAFEMQARAGLSEEQLTARIFYDGGCDPGMLDLPLLEQLSELAPFGAGNPEPLFLLRDVQARSPRVLGSSHLAFEIFAGEQRLRCIAFGMARQIETLGGPVDLLAVPEFNHWKGRKSIQLRVRDLRPSGCEDK